MAGFVVLVLFSYSQRDVLSDAIKTVTSVQAGWFLILLASFWVLLPLTAISYKIISPKPRKMSVFTTSLAHLAGAGPGRIIPGGIGNMSIGAIHLKKSGLTIEQGIAVVATNNAFGLITNILLVCAVLILRPDTLKILTDNISSQQLVIATAVIVGSVVLLQWLLHAHKTRHEILKTIRSWKNVLHHLFDSPQRLFWIVSISVLILAAHTMMLDFSGFALGVDLSFTDALIALSFGVAIGSIFPTPGGVGAVEAGTSAALVVLGYDAATATSIAVLFRIATYWQPLIPGTMAYLYLREKRLL